ncbi:hypothetical protein [Lacinutrix sp. Hel_I_90]|uniref:hypothetical protein n=1 Tax=Lacinutrix sp. Hel_I_90 TaxID=1249999 RepID=UPI0005CB0F76|nr:hypothetical protein [Lacinutrix sp. Hel_I_90]
MLLFYQMTIYFFTILKQNASSYNFSMYSKQNDSLKPLYLDGFISKTYLPAKNKTALDGEFEVIMAF